MQSHDEYTDDAWLADHADSEAAAEPRLNKKKVIALVIAVVLIITGVFLFMNRSSDADVEATGDFTPMDILVSSQKDDNSEEAADPSESQAADADADMRIPNLQDNAKEESYSPPAPELVEEGTSQQNLVAPQEVEAPAEARPGTPVSITVHDKAAGIDRTATTIPVGHIGPADAATLAPPEDISQIGWYHASAEPGSDGEGTTVMTGHVNYDGVIGFASLFSHMKAGDEITVTTENGDVHRYRVKQDVYQVPKTLDEEYVRMTEDTLQRATGPNALVLLTCGGAFDPNSPLGYQDNMIVVADPI